MSLCASRSQSLHWDCWYFFPARDRWPLKRNSLKCFRLPHVPRHLRVSPDSLESLIALAVTRSALRVS
jgi:hypothetical protein